MIKICMQLFLSLSLAYSAWGETEYILPISGHLRLKSSANVKIHVSNSKAIKITDLSNDIEIYAKKEGQTTVRIGNNSYLIRVVSSENYITYNKIKAVTENMLGLDLRMGDKMVQIDGVLLRIDDWVKIANSLNPNDHFLFSAKIPDEYHAQATQLITELIKRHRLDNIDLQFTTPVISRIPKESAAKLEEYEKLLRPYGIAVTIDEGLIEHSPMIRVKITVAEIKREYFRHLGIAWPESYSAKLIQSPNSSQPNSLEITLNAVENNGMGKILATPNLLCRSGKEASFLAGGEFPIKIVNLNTHDVVWKKYGVLLKVKPRADVTGKMSIEIETEVSTLDMAHTVDGIPGLLTNRIQSHFNMHQARTIALSGLLKNESGKATQGLPGLSNIPILGELFRSENYRESRSELIIFVTPEIHNENVAAENLPKLPEGWYE